jgi:hypothetical protein
MPSDTSEKGLESIIVDSLVNDAKYLQGDANDFDREHAIDLTKLIAFVQDTQPKAFVAHACTRQPAQNQIPAQASRRDRKTRRY